MVLLEHVGTEAAVLVPSDIFCSRSSFIWINFNLMSYASQHDDSIKFPLSHSHHIVVASQQPLACVHWLKLVR